MSEVTLIKGDATERWPLPDNSLDSIVTDPPYGIAFMGKAWDDKGGPQAYQEWTTLWAREAFRCLKPGGFLLAFGATRMAHRMACGIEAAGFRIVDTVIWLYLSGFPKAQDIGKMFDKWAGAEREVVGVLPYSSDASIRGGKYGAHGYGRARLPITAPTTPLAKKWDGWKTPSLKPAHEPIIMAQKPFSGTYIDNIERWGVGAINVDGCRIPTEDNLNRTGSAFSSAGSHEGWKRPAHNEYQRLPASPLGRFPANLILSHGPDCTAESCVDGCPVKVLDGQSGVKVSRRSMRGVGLTNSPVYGSGRLDYDTERGHDDVGGASKIFAKFFYEEADFAGFYYCSKASAKERNAGCEALPGVRKNHHPTVKPLKLVRYLQRLVTPPGGITASPFLGSGTDAVAAIMEGLNFWGMEISDEYWPIIEARVAEAKRKKEAEMSRPVVH